MALKILAGGLGLAVLLSGCQQRAEMSGAEVGPSVFILGLMDAEAASVNSVEIATVPVTPATTYTPIQTWEPSVQFQPGVPLPAPQIIVSEPIFIEQSAPPVGVSSEIVPEMPEAMPIVYQAEPFIETVPFVEETALDSPPLFGAATFVDEPSAARSPLPIPRRDAAPARALQSEIVQTQTAPPVFTPLAQPGLAGYGEAF